MDLGQNIENVTLVREPRWFYHPKKYTPQRIIPPGAQPSPNQPTWEDIGLESSKEWEPNKIDIKPLSPDIPTAKEVVQKEFSITKERPKGIIQTPLGPVTVNNRFVNHLIDHHQGEHRERYAEHIRWTLEDPNEIWLTELELDGKSVGFRNYYLSVFLDDKRRTVVSVVNQDKFGRLLWTAWGTAKLCADNVSLYAASREHSLDVRTHK